MKTGWVYILSNRSMPGVVKVGVTSSHPEERARQLDSTGVPDSFKVETAFLFSDNALLIEQKAHQLLDDFRRRNNREFFECSPKFAAEKILEAAETQKEVILKTQPTLLTEGEIRQIKLREEQAARRKEFQIVAERRHQEQEQEAEEREKVRLIFLRREREKQRHKQDVKSLGISASCLAIAACVCFVFSVFSFSDIEKAKKGKSDPMNSWAHNQNVEDLRAIGISWLVGAVAFGVAFSVQLIKRKKVGAKGPEI